MIRPASRGLAVMVAAVAAGTFSQGIDGLLGWSPLRWYVVRVTSCESQLEVVVGLPCFCPFVTVAGRGCCRQRWLAAAGLLVLQAC